MIRSPALGAFILAATCMAALADDDFPIAGTYMRDQACVGTGAHRPDLLVTITRQHIDSPMGACRILSRRRAGPAISAHVECKIPSGQLILGDVTFTVREDRTIAFEDQDHISDGTLHPCDK